MSSTLFRYLCYDTGKSRYFRCSYCDYGVLDVFEDGFKVFESGLVWSYCPNCGRQIVSEKVFYS